MNRVRMIARRLLRPPAWVLFIASPAVFAALAVVFIAGWNDYPPAAALYSLSAYCLLAWALAAPELAGRLKRAVLSHVAVRRALDSDFGRRYRGDALFRGRVSLYRGMSVNFLYVLFRAAVGVRYASAWFISMAVYYLALGRLRLGLVWSGRRGGADEERRAYRRTGWLLLGLNIPMGGMIVQMVLKDAGYSYPGYVVYLSAAYTFYMAIRSIVDLVRSRRLGSPLLSAARAINFVAATMSVLGLQTAMLARFSQDGEAFRRTMNAITGAAVWSGAILTGAAMLRRSFREERRP